MFLPPFLQHCHQPSPAAVTVQTCKSHFFSFQTITLPSLQRKKRKGKERAENDIECDAGEKPCKKLKHVSCCIVALLTALSHLFLCKGETGKMERWKKGLIEPICTYPALHKVESFETFVRNCVQRKTQIC